MESPTLEAQSFRSWLERLPADAAVGYRGSYDSCPIARWLIEAEGHRGVFIRPRRYRWTDGAETVQGPLPLWAQRFLRAVDATPGAGPVTADLALWVLGDVTHPERRLRLAG